MPFEIQPLPNNKFKIPYNKWAEVEIGGEEVGKFKPHAKLKRWGDECWIKIGIPHEEEDEFEYEFEENKIKIKKKDNGEYELELYPLEPTEQYKQGGFEFEIILNKKPSTNKIVLDIETKGLKFYYQPPLTKEIDGIKIVTATETGGYDKNGIRTTSRPLNVIDSYAVYHKTQDKFFKTKQEGEKYLTGKAFHIYRPKIIDAVGNWAWSEQRFHIDENGMGTQTITISQDFLDNAVYPIRHAGGDTFGFTGEGGSDNWTSIDQAEGSLFTSPATGGTGDSLHFYCYEDRSGVVNAKGVIALHADLTLLSNGVGDSFQLDSSVVWETSAFSTSPTIIASTEYVLAIIPDSGISNVSTKYDSGAEDQSHYDFSNSYATPEDFGTITHGTRKMSIYCTYTPAAAARVPTLGLLGVGT